jgi:hypothetical protein
MDSLLNIISVIEEQFGAGVLLLVPFILFIGAVAKWKLFVKCDQPGYAAIIPGYDIIITLRIVGRPDWHILFFLIPVFNIYFAFKLIIELVQSFGHFSMVDYIMAIVFNVFYVLNMGLAYNEVYCGPVYRSGREAITARKAELA